MAETPKEQKESAQIDSREMEGMRFDDILGLIGEMGVYQVVLLLLIFLAIIPMALQSMIYVFESDKVDHWCNVIEWSDAVKKCLDLRDNPENYLQCVHRYRDSSIPSTNEDGLVEYSKCLKYDIEYPSKLSDDFIIDNFTYSKIQCDEGWVYDQHQYISTTVTEFDLVCEKSHLSGTTQSIFYFGYLVGAWSSGSLADLIGRYYTFFLSVLICFISGMILSFSQTYWFFCLFRFLIGVSNIAIYIISFVIVTELVGPSKRVYSGLLMPLAFSVGCMVLALLAFLVRDWRNLQLVASLTLLPLFLLIPIIPESPRWLMDRNDYEEAEKILRKVATFNKTLDKLPSNLTEILHEGQKNSEINLKKENTIVHIFKKPRMRMATFILFALCNIVGQQRIPPLPPEYSVVNASGNNHLENKIYKSKQKYELLLKADREQHMYRPLLLCVYCKLLVIALVYFTISLNAAKFGHNVYVTFFLLGLVEVPAILFCYPLMESPLGRRFSLFGLLVGSGIACLFGIILSKGLLLTIVAMIGKFMSTAAFSVLYLYTAEILPTTVRSSGMGVCAAIARIGSISSPIILIIGDVWKPFPYIVCGPMALVVASAVLILPDTRRIALPGTLKDAEDFLERNRRSRKGKEGIAGNQSAQAGGMTNEAFIDCKEV